MTAVHQLLPVYSTGDAIGIATRQTQHMLRSLGFASTVYADVIDRRLEGAAEHPDGLRADIGAADTLVYHLSIGSPLARRFLAAPCRRVLVYHNITPERYYALVSPRVTYWLRRGRQDLNRLAPAADLVIADSRFNAEEALVAGARRVAVVPPPMDIARLRPGPASPTQPPSLLFVGRLAPNKCQHDLIRALAVLRRGRHADARLTLAGGANDTGPYARALRRLAVDLGLGDAVDIASLPLDDGRLADHYRAASLYASASEHEGFGVPLVEAMAFDVPILAFRAAAVPETLSDAGLLLGTKDPFTWAVAIERLLTDDQLREQLAAAGRRRLTAFSPEAIRERLRVALAGIGVVP